MKGRIMTRRAVSGRDLLRPNPGTPLVLVDEVLGLDDQGADIDVRLDPYGNRKGARVITILIVDPHIVVRHGLSGWLATIPDVDVVGVASDGQEGVDVCEALHPDVVLMDIATPVRNGLEAIAEIRERWPDIAVIAFTATADGEVVNAAFAAGAMGYLLKDVAPEMLVSSLRSVLEGGLPLSPQIAAHLFTVTRSPRSVYDSLSPRERQVLDMIARGDQNKEIAVALGISDNTVRVYCSSLFQRLGVTSRTQAAVWATRTLRSA